MSNKTNGHEKTEDQKRRDEFAAAALIALIIKNPNPESNIASCTSLAYQFSNSMLLASKSRH